MKVLLKNSFKYVQLIQVVILAVSPSMLLPVEKWLWRTGRPFKVAAQEETTEIRGTIVRTSRAVPNVTLSTADRAHIWLVEPIKYEAVEF